MSLGGGVNMAKKNENRVLVSLMCEECKNINYTEEKNKKNTPEKLELNKYCKHCRKTTKHKETKKDRKSTRLNSSHKHRSRMPSSA